MAKEREDSLFAGARSLGGGPGPPSASEPLAARMRPRSLDEFVGQDHIVGPGRLLRRAIQKDQLSSIILSGPPGTGKTTLARVIANGTVSRFVTLNAVLAGVADIRQAIEEARRHRELYDRKTILFVDEVHRWNKAQQDALLPWVESGTIVLIGATTENPFFEVNRALVSRSRVFQLAPLGEESLRAVAAAALGDVERGYGRWKVVFEPGALEHLVAVSDGDARSLLNALELAVETSAQSWPPSEGSQVSVAMAAAEESIQRRAVLYDKDGDYHYDAASAFIKSLRGSDPDAALYWLARMVYAGEDPRFVFRRMLISASEDIGLADPAAIGVVLSCAETFDRIGMPEGQFPLAEAALYLATAPKSNSALGFFDALKSVEAEAAEVPTHIKDASRDAKGFGHGEGYLYPHAFRDHWVAQEYLPETLRGRVFYHPGSLGLEGQRRDLVLERREAQVAAAYEAERSPTGEAAQAEAGAEQGSWSKAGEDKARWRSRAESSATRRLAIVRDALYELASPSRADRILVLDAREGYLVWEALRRSVEGTVAAAVSRQGERELVEQYASTLQELERPLVAFLRPESVSGASLEEAFGFSRFDLVLGRELFAQKADPAGLLASLLSAIPGARLVSAEALPREGDRLSSILARGDLAQGGLSPALLARFAAFEDGFYADPASPLGPGQEALRASLEKAGAASLGFECRSSEYPRSFTRRELEAWFSPSSPYGAAAAPKLGAEELSLIASAAETMTEKRPASWRFSILYVSAAAPGMKGA